MCIRQRLLVHRPHSVSKVACKVEDTPTATMFFQPVSICLALLILTAQTLAQCSDSDSQPCSASNAADVADADVDATAVNDGLAELFAAADVGIGPGEKWRFFRRQDTGEGSSSLCCSPDTECLSITGTPFCYVRSLFLPNTIQDSR